jgi:hypothetical protein
MPRHALRHKKSFITSTPNFFGVEKLCRGPLLLLLLALAFRGGRPESSSRPIVIDARQQLKRSTEQHGFQSEGHTEKIYKF